MAFWREIFATSKNAPKFRGFWAWIGKLRLNAKSHLGKKITPAFVAGDFISNFIRCEETFSELGKFIGKNRLAHICSKSLKIAQIMQGEEPQAENFISADEMTDISARKFISAGVTVAI